MEIQRIYSEVDTDERLYSVLLSEQELRLFTKSKDNTSLTAREALSVGMIPVVSKMTEQDLPSGILNKKFYKKYESKVKELGKHEENKRLIEELIKDARKQKTAVHFVRDGKGTGSFYYSPESFNKEVINDYYKISKKNLKKNDLKSLDDLLFYSKVRKNADNIILDTNEASTLAHELGHSKHHGGRDGSKIGKLAHKLRNTKLAQLDRKLVNSASAFSPLVRNGAPLSMAAGFASGYDSGKKLAKGEKDSVVNKTAYAALPVIHQAPKLVSEFEASRQGIKLLKKAGASKEFIKQSRKALGNAYGTYAAGLATPIALGYLARQAGKVTGKLSESDKKKNQTKTNNK